MQKKIRIGELLLQQGLITEAQLEAGLHEQKALGQKLGKTLVGLGYLQEDALMSCLALQMNVPYVRLHDYPFDHDLIHRLNEVQARRFRSLVLQEEKGLLLVGMVDPGDFYVMDELEQILQQPINMAIVSESELLAATDLLYRRSEEIVSLAGELEGELRADRLVMPETQAVEDKSDAVVVRLLDSIFEDALRVRASDIHIEPDKQVVRLRQRVDGVLQEQVIGEKRITNALVNRLKLMSSLNISEKRRPQDGRFHLAIKERSIDVRLSTMPGAYGESVVMRLLDQSQGVLDLDRLGMPEGLLTRFRRLIRRPHGLVLVTGPTGSGKTTTLYGALSELNQAEVKIITAEDPVEYQLPRITQVQVNPKINLFFSSVLRSALRQDPDIILVGEMRDQETAEIALRAALTGHLVLSTLHTNDAVGTAMRLMDMGAQPYLVASALNGVLAQRLVRRNCQNCSQPVTPTDTDIERCRALLPEEEVPDSVMVGQGCLRCGKTGYLGRIGVYELLELNEPLMEALRTNQPADFAREARAHRGYRPLACHALDYARQGITTLDEVFRICAASGAQWES